MTETEDDPAITMVSERDRPRLGHTFSHMAMDERKAHRMGLTRLLLKGGQAQKISSRDILPVPEYSRLLGEVWLELLFFVSIVVHSTREEPVQRYGHHWAARRAKTTAAIEMSLAGVEQGVWRLQGTSEPRSTRIDGHTDCSTE